MTEVYANEQLLPCSCGGKAELKSSIGGSTIYYGIYCQKCGKDNRHYDSAICAYGLGVPGSAPPMNILTAIKDWNTKWRLEKQ